MLKPVALALAAAALTVTAIHAGAQARVEAAQVPGKQPIAYGSDPLQVVDYWPGPTASAPLVVYVHGGGWKRGDKQMIDGSAKLSDWHARGYAVASVNYRLVPEATVEQEAADVAAAVAALKRRAGALGFDGRRIALVGHSAGAHLVALVGTDPRYLQAAGLSFADIAGIVPLDGAAYDVAAQLGDGPRIMHKTYRQAFGDDPARQRALSPTLQAGAPNVREFLVLHVDRMDGVRQSEALAAALRRGGSHVEIQGFGGRGLRGHMQINRELGEPGYPATAVVDRFLARVFG